jgi:hypothetical protein
MLGRLLPVALLPLGVFGCGSFPEYLWETGLFAQGDPEAISDGVIPFSPRFTLWSDGSDKKRWLKVPTGQQIDTSDGDRWTFPEGTQLWKEFSKDGLRIETRILEKGGPEPEDWDAATYAWNDAETEATKVGARGKKDARDTTHDIPESWMCAACHEGGGVWPLGVSAIQLSSGGDATGLQALLDADAFTEPPPTLTLPGDNVAQEAIGYLHGNCGSCHHENVVDSFSIFNVLFGPSAPEGFSLKLLPSELTSLEDTAVHRTAVNQEIAEETEGATVRILPGDAEDSGVVKRMERLQGEDGRMPIIASDEVDTDALAGIKDWINALPTE